LRRTEPGELITHDPIHPSATSPCWAVRSLGARLAGCRGGYAIGMGAGGRRRLLACVAAVAGALATATATVEGALATGPAAARASATPRAELAYSHAGRIYSLAADGSGRRLLAAPASRDVEFASPAWSPDGSALAFARVLRGGDEGAQILVEDASGTRAVTPSRSRVLDFHPSWAPDGRRLAFVRLAEGRQRATVAIVVAAPDGSGAREIVREPVRERLLGLERPVWLPDGHTVSYVRTVVDRRGYLRPTLYTVSDSGGEPRPLLKDAQSASWSPDGTRIAFASVRDAIEDDCTSDECDYAAELYVANADGSGARRLTRDTGSADNPRWSPDGSRILFSSDRNFPAGDSAELYSIAADGACLTWLTNGSPASEDGVWRPGASAADADPGRCGAAGRKPRIEVSLDRRARGLLWLGRTHQDLLLSGYQPGRRATYIEYGDCGRFVPHACPPPVLVTDSSSCGGSSDFIRTLGLGGAHAQRLRGALAVYRGPIEAADLFSGTTLAQVTFDRTVTRPRARYLGLLRSLVRVGSRRRPGARLAPPRLPPAQARAVARAVEVRSRYPSLRGAARALGVSPGTLRGRLILGRALRRLGTGGRTRC